MAEEVGSDSPSVAGNPLDILPDAIGLTNGNRGPFSSEESARTWLDHRMEPLSKGVPTSHDHRRIYLGAPDRDLAEALRLFRTAGLDAAEVIYQDDYPAAIRPSDKRSAQQAAAIAAAEGIPIVGLHPVHHRDQQPRRDKLARTASRSSARMPRHAHKHGRRGPCSAGAWRGGTITPPTGTSSGQLSASLLRKQSTRT